MYFMICADIRAVNILYAVFRCTIRRTFKYDNRCSKKEVIEWAVNFVEK